MSNTKKATTAATVLDDEFSIEYAGATYTLTREDMDDLEVVLMFQRGEVLAAVVRVLGDEQWNRFAESVRTDKGKIPMTETKKFLDLVAEPLGNFASSLVS